VAIGPHQGGPQLAVAGAAIWVMAWVLPFTFMIMMAWGCETHDLVQHIEAPAPRLACSAPHNRREPYRARWALDGKQAAALGLNHGIDAQMPFSARSPQPDELAGSVA